MSDSKIFDETSPRRILELLDGDFNKLYQKLAEKIAHSRYSDLDWESIAASAIWKFRTKLEEFAKNEEPVQSQRAVMFYAVIGAGKSQLGEEKRFVQPSSPDLEKLFQRLRRELTPEEILLNKEMATMISVATQKLPAKLRSAWILVDVQNLDYKTVGTVLGIPDGTVKSRVSTARRTLRTKLERILGQRSGSRK